MVVVVESVHDAEARAQRCRKGSRARGGADEREPRQGELDRSGRRPGVDHDVETEILHGGIQVFLHDGAEAMDLVDEENVSLLEIREQTRQISGLFEHGAGRGLDLRAHLTGDDVAQRRLAQTGRTCQEDVVESFATASCGSDEDLEVLDDLGLPREVAEMGRAQRCVEVVLRTRGFHRRMLSGFCHGQRPL